MARFNLNSFLNNDRFEDFFAMFTRRRLRP